jgi:glutathione S-transferase
MPPTVPLLYSFRRCPYAMRARMALLQAGVAFDVREVVLRDKPAALLALSPKGTVPVLHLPDGTVLDESWHVMRWAWAQGDPQGWWARAQSAANLALLATCDGAFKHHLDRYKYPERHADALTGDLPPRDVHRAQAAAVLLQPLEARLRAAAFLGGDTPCATDVAIFPFVRQFAAVEPAWWGQQPWPALQGWWAQWQASPLLAACMLGRGLP